MAQLEIDWDPEPAKRLELLTVDELYAIADQRVLVSLKEDRRIERKPAGFSGESLGEYLSMWANTCPDGGLICLGMNDNGTFAGCSSLSNQQLNSLESLANVCDDARCESKRVAITKPDGSSDFVVLLRVYYREGRLVRTPKGKAFIRRGDQKHKLSAEEARELSVDKGEMQFEQEPCKQVSYPQDFDREAIRAFAASVRERLDLVTDLSDEGVLNVRHLGTIAPDGKTFIPNIACVLLFAKEPDRVVPGCKIRFMRFDGEQEGTGEKYNAVKDIWIEGMTVPKMIHKAEQLLDSHIRSFSPLEKDKRFHASPEYPKAAWYEAIVNACAHRSYGDGLKNMTIYVKMFDDKLVIESPGPFMPFVTPKTIYGQSIPRNPKMMGAMFFMSFVKMAAEGTRRMRDTMKYANLPEPEFEQKEVNYSLVRVTLRNNIQRRRVWVDLDAVAIVGAALASTLTEKEKRIINFVAEHGRVNVTDTARLLEVGWATAKRFLDKLVERKILEHVHSPSIKLDAKAYYQLPSIK